MAEMHWFRWHHGTVDDPKMSLIAQRAGASLAEVLAVWAWLLESASRAEDRGCPGLPDFDVLEHRLGLSQGMGNAIYSRMVERGLVAAETGRLAAWSRRQPKREDDGAVERKRRQREREGAASNATAATPKRTRNVPAGHGVSREVPTEERRGEKNISPPTPSSEGERATNDAIHPDAEKAASAMRAAGAADIEASRPELSAWLHKGVTVEQLADAARNAVARGAHSPGAYAFKVVADRLASAASVANGASLPAVAWDSSRSSIEAKGEALGLGRWDRDAFDVGSGEPFAAYHARVRAAVDACGAAA